MLAMTSPTAQLQLQPQLPKPVLLTKPVGKYRAPVAPPALHLDSGRQQADPAPQPSTTAANHTCSFAAAGADGPLTSTNVSTAPAAATSAATASVLHHPDLSPTSSTKYRAPGPPTSSSLTTAISVSTTPSCNISSNNNMRREPMQVLRTNSYNKSSSGGGGGVGGQINPNNNNNDDADETDGDAFRDKLAIKKSDLSSPVVLDSSKNGPIDGCHEHARQIKAGVDQFSLVDASRSIHKESISGSNSNESRPAAMLPPDPDRMTSQSTTADAVTEKPIVADVKLVNRLSINTGRQPVSQPVQIRPCRSTESIAAIDQLNALLASGLALMTSSTANGDASEPSKAEQANDESAVGEKPVQRSSFVDPNSLASQSGRRSVYIDLGEYQTLLKHGQEDAVYSLPQPQCYGDETLRAVRLITEKYDTFKRRQLRAISFRDGTVVKPQFGAQLSSNGSGPDVDVVVGQVSAIPEGVELADDARPGSRNEGQSAAVTSQPPDQRIPDRTSLKPQCEATSGQNDDVSASQTTSNLSRPVVSLSRYRLESVGHVGMSSTDDVTLLPPEVEMDVQVDDDCFGGVSRTDRLRIEMFYRSRETSVYVCRSLADMFLGACSSTETAAVAAAQCWVHVHTGVPVWLLNSGRGAVRRRELILVLADRLSGFPLWRDRINYLSNYASTSLPTPTTTTTAVPTPAPPPDVVGHVSETQSGGISVHSLRLSGSLTKVVRLAIFDGHSADAFYAKFQEITADPNDDLWRISDVGSSLVTGRASGRRKDAKRPSSMLLCAGRRSRRRHDNQLSKTAISQPCSVVHVARIDPHQPSFRAAFSDFIVGLLPAAILSDQSNPTQSPNTTVCAPNGESGGNRDDTSNRNSWPTDDFRPRLPTN